MATYFCPHCEAQCSPDDLLEMDDETGEVSNDLEGASEMLPVWCKDCEAETMARAGVQCDECGNDDVYPL